MSELFDVLGVKIAVTNLQDACQSIENWIKERQKTYVCVAPVSTIVDCQRDSEYRKIINNAGMTTPDGMPLVWLGRLRGNKRLARTYGPDLMLKVCALSEAKGYRHFFYGGTPQTCDLLVENLKKGFPKLDIAGALSPLFQPGRLEERPEVLAQIDSLKPDIIWVGLGSPKQDYWMYHHRNKLNVPVMIGVGAAFDFLSGVKKQAPRWMRKSGLEWFFRLCCEPRRLWKRYLIGNAGFIYYLTRDLLFKKSFKKA